MAGIYGNILDHFPEMFTLVSFWEMSKLPAGGFSAKSNERNISVITLNKSGDAIKRKKLINEWILDNVGNDIIYAYDSADISLGSYMIHPYTGDLNRVAMKFGYSMAGGLIVWGIQKVQGEDYQDPRSLAPIGGTF